MVISATFTDELVALIGHSGFYFSRVVHGIVLLELVDARVLGQLVQLLLGELFVQKLGESSDLFFQVALHVLVEDEVHVRVVPQGPRFFYIVEVRSPCNCLRLRSVAGKVM